MEPCDYRFYRGNFFLPRQLFSCRADFTPTSTLLQPPGGKPTVKKEGSALYQDNCSARQASPVQQLCCPAQNCQLANSPRVQCSLDFGDEYTVEQGWILLEAWGNLVTHRGHQVGCPAGLLYCCNTVLQYCSITVFLYLLYCRSKCSSRIFYFY